MLRPITTEEMATLQFATVRESRGRHSWPTEVVKAFLAAEVIRDREERRTESPCARVARRASDNGSAHEAIMFD